MDAKLCLQTISHVGEIGYLQIGYPVYK